MLLCHVISRSFFSTRGGVPCKDNSDLWGLPLLLGGPILIAELTRGKDLTGDRANAFSGLIKKRNQEKKLGRSPWHKEKECRVWSLAQCSSHSRREEWGQQLSRSYLGVKKKRKQRLCHMLEGGGNLGSGVISRRPIRPFISPREHPKKDTPALRGRQSTSGSQGSQRV